MKLIRSFTYSRKEQIKMPVCADERWDMELEVESAPSSEHFTFEVDVDNENISGRVIDSDGNETDLSGRCSLISSNGQQEVSLMNFRFIAKGLNGDVEIVMSGIGFQPRDPSLDPIFMGSFIALAPTSAVGSALPVRIDEGDTGTGTGQQT
jgi:hypothetical protein